MAKQPVVLNSDNKNKAYALRNMISSVDLSNIHRHGILSEVVKQLNQEGEKNQENIDVGPYVDLSNLGFTTYPSKVSALYPEMSFNQFAGNIAEVYAIARGIQPGKTEIDEKTITGLSNSPYNPFSVKFNRQLGFFTYYGVLLNQPQPVRLFDHYDIPTLADLAYAW